MAGCESTLAVAEKANNLLVYKEFQQCLDVCHEGLKVVRHSVEDPSCEPLKETFCVAAIQAYGELDQWQEVLPFINQLYPSLEEAPVRVVQLCILLHAEVRDFPTCAALANIWLKHPSNWEPPQEHYLETIDLYVGHVLIPADMWQDIPGFLEGCPGLSDGHREHFLKVIRTLRHQVDQIQCEQIQVAEDPSPSPETGTHPEQRSQETKSGDNSLLPRLPVKLQTLIHSVQQWTSKHIPVLTLHIIRHLALISLVIYILITKADIDFLSWKTLATLWNFVRHLWRRMFGSYHTAKQKDLEG